MFFTPVNEQEVRNIVFLLKNSSPGWDDISAKVIKNSFDLYIQPLTHILNMSLTQGVVPNELKLAKVIPLFKSGDKQLIKNYRPVSILPVFSKIFERISYNRLYSFITQNNLLYKYQFGFKKHYGTNSALILLIDKIMNSLNNGDIVLGLFLDFSKAFDCVNHEILIRKMSKYGIRGLCLDWFIDYLSQRKQYVLYNGNKSCEQIISCGVPQGSILGPVLFLLYINDLPNISEKLFTILYADDSNIFLVGKNAEVLIRTLNNEMYKLINWLNANQLCLNIDKTQYMFFSLRKHISCNLHVTMNNQNIKRVDCVKFLGIYIDSQLSWHNHINYIKSKISKGIGVLCKARKYFDINTLTTLYYSFVYPYLTYCVEVWVMPVIVTCLLLLNYKRKLLGLLCLPHLNLTLHLYFYS